MSEPSVEATQKPRRWLAILLSILMPGLGHAYAGAPLRGFAFVVGITVVTVPLLLLHVSVPTVASLAG